RVNKRGREARQIVRRRRRAQVRQRCARQTRRTAAADRGARRTRCVNFRGRSMQQRQLDPRQLRKRALFFYFAAGVNVLMAFWVWSAAGGKAGSGTLLLITLVFLVFAGLNYYMASRSGKSLRHLASGPPPGRDATGANPKVNE